MRKNIIALIAVAYVVLCVSPVIASDYDERYQFIIDSGISEEFDLLAVKSDRPMPWQVFADNTYETLKGDGGKRADSDWFDNKVATIWLVILDKDFRSNAKLVYLDKNAVDNEGLRGWYSLTELEKNIYPVLMEKAMDGRDEKAMEIIEGVIGRGAMVNNLQLQFLLLVPDAEGGPGWESAIDAGEPYAADAQKMLSAYEAGDKEGLVKAAGSLAANLEKAPYRHSTGLISFERFTHTIKPLYVAFWIYLAVFVILLIWLIVRKKIVADIAVWLVVVGVLFHLFAIVARTIISGHFPTASMYEYLVVFSWASALSFVIFYFVTRQGFLGIIVVPVAFLLIVVAELFFSSHIDNQLLPALQSYWLVIHVSMAALAEGAFAVAFGAGVLYLLRPLFGPEEEGSFMPSRDKLDRIGYAAVSIGFPLFTIGALIAGAIWAQKAWSIWWSWDPKEVASLIVFIIATLYLHARHARGWKGTRTAVLQIVIFVAAVLTLFSNLVLGGLHSY